MGRPFTVRVRFNRSGFDNVSLKQILAGAVLTHCPSLRVLVHRSGMREFPGRVRQQHLRPRSSPDSGKTSAEWRRARQLEVSTANTFLLSKEKLGFDLSEPDLRAAPG